MKIEVLGPGCQRCNDLHTNTLAAVTDMGSESNIDVVKITDVRYFAEKGVLMTPGLIIDGEVISTGKVLTRDEIKKIIEEKS